MITDVKPNFYPGVPRGGFPVTGTTTTPWSSPSFSWSDAAQTWGAADISEGLFPSLISILAGALSTFRTSTTYNSVIAYSSSSQIYGGGLGYEESRQVPVFDVSDPKPRF